MEDVARGVARGELSYPLGLFHARTGHREYGLGDYLVGLTEGWLEERGIGTAPERQPPPIAFLD